MIVSEILRAIRKRWWTIVLLTVLGAGCAMYFTSTEANKYQSSITFFVSTPSSNDAAALAADQFASRRVNSYVRLLKSEILAQQIHNGGVDLPPGRIAGEIQGSADLNTVLLTATVQDASKARAYKIAQLIGLRFDSVVAGVDAQAKPAKVDGQSYAVQLKVTSGPSVLAAPVYPRKNLNLMLGIAVGLLAGFITAWVRELTDTSVRSTEELTATTELPVLGSVPYDRGAKKSPLLLVGQSNPTRAEAFRKIRTGLQFAGVDRPIHVLTVTSSLPGEGKTSTTVNVGVVTAEAGKRVLIVDCDMRRPQVASYTGINGAVGLTDVLRHEIDAAQVIQPWGEAGLDILPAGALPPNPSELMSSRAMADLMVDLRTKYDLIILDTPPLVPVTDASISASFSDGVLLVVRQRRVSRANIRIALRSLKAVDAHVIGTAFSMVKDRNLTDSYATYGQTPRWWHHLVPGRRNGARVATREPAAAATHVEKHAVADDANEDTTIERSRETRPSKTSVSS